MLILIETMKVCEERRVDDLLASLVVCLFLKIMSSSFVGDWILTHLYVFANLVGAIRVFLSCHLIVIWSHTQRTQTLAKTRSPIRKRARDECNNVRRDDEMVV